MSMGPRLPCLLAQLRGPARVSGPTRPPALPACPGLYSPCTDPDDSAASLANTGLAWLAVEGEGLRRTTQKCTALPKGHVAGAGAPPAQREL